MAKLSSVNKNNRRIKLSDKYYKKRKNLKKIIMNKKISLEERFKAQQKLSKLPRNSSKTRVMNRCQITGRPHGVYYLIRNYQQQQVVQQEGFGWVEGMHHHLLI